MKVIADEMLPIYENDYGERLVNARELHGKLMIATRFNDWISRMIESYGFVENDDFYSYLSKTAGRPSKEYLLTLDTAKEIAIVQNNEMGRAIRKYFIEVEKRYRLQKPKSALEVLQMAVNQLVEQEKRMKQVEEKISVVEHRLDNIDKIDVLGDLQQRLNAMIRKYAQQNGLTFSKAWNEFRQAYNTAYRTNLKIKMNHFAQVHGIKNLTMPQYFSLTNSLEDAIRVADKMLNNEEAKKYA